MSSHILAMKMMPNAIPCNSVVLSQTIVNSCSTSGGSERAHCSHSIALCTVLLLIGYFVSETHFLYLSSFVLNGNRIWDTCSRKLYPVFSFLGYIISETHILSSFVLNRIYCIWDTCSRKRVSQFNITKPSSGASECTFQSDSDE